MHELPQLHVAGDPPGPLTAPPKLGTALSRPRTLVARGLMNVPADPPADSRWTTPQLQGIGTDAAPGMQQSAIVICSDSKRNGRGDHGRPLLGKGAYFLMSPDFRTTAWPRPPASAGTAADSHDPHALNCHSLFYQLIIGRIQPVGSSMSVKPRASPLPPR